jgi:hypothetical protein
LERVAGVEACVLLDELDVSLLLDLLLRKKRENVARITNPTTHHKPPMTTRPTIHTSTVPLTDWEVWACRVV